MFDKVDWILVFKHFVILRQQTAGTIDQANVVVAIDTMRRPRATFL